MGIRESSSVQTSTNRIYSLCKIFELILFRYLFTYAEIYSCK